MRILLVLTAVLTMCGCGVKHGVTEATNIPISRAEPLTTKLPETTDIGHQTDTGRDTPPGGNLCGGPPERHKEVDLETLNAQLSDIFFDYDQADLTQSQLATLEKDAAIIRSILDAFPQAKIIVEGHCDERGSSEYNLALGDRRARRVAQSLQLSSVETVSFGKEKPQCDEPTEACRSRNRRAHLAVR